MPGCSPVTLATTGDRTAFRSKHDHPRHLVPPVIGNRRPLRSSSRCRWRQPPFLRSALEAGEPVPGHRRRPGRLWLPTGSDEAVPGTRLAFGTRLGSPAVVVPADEGAAAAAAASQPSSAGELQLLPVWAGTSASASCDQPTELRPRRNQSDSTASKMGNRYSVRLLSWRHHDIVTGRAGVPAEAGWAPAEPLVPPAGAAASVSCTPKPVSSALTVSRRPGALYTPEAEAAGWAGGSAGTAGSAGEGRRNRSLLPPAGG